VPVEDLPQILREARPQDDTTRNDPSDDVKLKYEGNGTSVTIPIDPQSQDFILELKGLERQGGPEKSDKPKVQAEQKKQKQVNKRVRRPDSTINQDSLVQAQVAEKIKQVLKDFRRAQNLFYRKDYKGALEMVNRSLETQRTADALGLKGTIFFMRDDISSAKYYWNKAVQMDPEIPVPNIPELETFINEIKATEDQQEAEE
jgi:tetratricopeptide (TPR) repeat protein